MKELKQLDICGTIINYEVIDRYDEIHYDDIPYCKDLLDNCVIQGIVSIVYFDGRLDRCDAVECSIYEGVKRLKSIYPQHLIIYTRNLDYDADDHDLITDFFFNIDSGSKILPFPYNRYHRYVYMEDHRDFNVGNIGIRATLGRAEEIKKRINDILQQPISDDTREYIEAYRNYLLGIDSNTLDM